MATKCYLTSKILRLFIPLCLAYPYLNNSFAQTAQNRSRYRVFTEAVAYSGFLEGKDNSGNVYDFYREVFAVTNGRLHKSGVATCGIALSSWYYLAGINPNIKLQERAYSWYEYCKDPFVFSRLTTPYELSRLQTGSAIVYTRKGGYHTGMFISSDGLDLITSEANTTSRRSLVSYSEIKDGQFICRTSLRGRGLTPYSVCDIIAQGETYTDVKRIQSLKKKYNVR